TTTRPAIENPSRSRRPRSVRAMRRRTSTGARASDARSGWRRRRPRSRPADDRRLHHVEQERVQPVQLCPNRLETSFLGGGGEALVTFLVENTLLVGARLRDLPGDDGCGALGEGAEPLLDC